MADEDEYLQFLTIHKGQLIVAGIPEQFWKFLHEKLKNEVSCSRLAVSGYLILGEQQLVA